VRLFAAIDLPADVQQALEQAMPPIDENLRRVPPEQWHLTLAFYGAVDETKAEALHAGLERAAARSRPMTVRLAGAGTFPRQPAKARVLWVGLDGDVDMVRRLADRCAGAGRRARIAMEARAFRPHLTLARARRGAADATQSVAALSGFASPWWTVTSLRLVQSHIGAAVRHETLREFSVTDDGQGSAEQ
jgi:RNA 2',3'-cyclic 3'-phosphodiesterase